MFLDGLGWGWGAGGPKQRPLNLFFSINVYSNSVLFHYHVASVTGTVKYHFKNEGFPLVFRQNRSSERRQVEPVLTSAHWPTATARPLPGHHAESAHCALCACPCQLGGGYAALSSARGEHLQTTLLGLECRSLRHVRCRVVSRPAVGKLFQ